MNVMRMMIRCEFRILTWNQWKSTHRIAVNATIDGDIGLVQLDGIHVRWFGATFQRIELNGFVNAGTF